MKMTINGCNALGDREGTRSEMYLDSAGLPTIGIGHLLTKEELRSGKIAGIGDWHSGLTSEQIRILLARDIAEAEKALDAVTVPLNPCQQDALISFIFNVGVGEPASSKGSGTGFLGSTLLRVLNRGEYDKVPEQMGRWIHSAGKVDKGLINRRESEIAQWNRPC